MQVCVYGCLGTIAGSLSPRVLPNGTQAISILCRFAYMIAWVPLQDRCHLGYSPMVPRQSQSYAGLCTFMIAWVPLQDRCHLGYSSMVPRQSQSYVRTLKDFYDRHLCDNDPFSPTIAYSMVITQIYELLPSYTLRQTGRKLVGKCIILFNIYNIECTGEMRFHRG